MILMFITWKLYLIFCTQTCGGKLGDKTYLYIHCNFLVRPSANARNIKIRSRWTKITAKNNTQYWKQNWKNHCLSPLTATLFSCRHQLV